MAQRDLLHGCARPPAPLSVPLLEMSSERNLTDCYPSSFPSLKSGLYLCFFTNVWFWFGTAGKGWEAHFTPLLLIERSFTMFVSDLDTVYTVELEINRL
jgi:hypothetical protein